MDSNGPIVFMLTTATFAVVPWGIALLAITYHPKLQQKRHRRNYRRITAGAAFALTFALTFPSMLPGAGPWFYLLAIGAAIAVTIHWHNWARTPNGASQLEDAKAIRERERHHTPHSREDNT